MWAKKVEQVIVTLVGGTVGGYTTFAGGHRLIDAGIKGRDALPEVTRSAVSAIGIASIMRIFLFLAALGDDMVAFLIGCSFTFERAMHVKPDIMITHAPGHMFITDMKEEHYSIL